MSSTQRRRRAAHSGGAMPIDGGTRIAPASGTGRPPRAQRIAALATVRAGGEHPGVGQVQGFLRRYGYLGAGEVVQEGRLDPPTSAALRRFQRQRQIPETGAFDAATRAELTQPVCGTPDRRPAGQAGRVRFNTPVGAWDRRDFRYAFTTAPGSSGTLSQTLTFDDAKASVRRAFDTWSRVDTQLRFKEVKPNEKPDVIVEWVPVDHSQQARDDTSGAWELPDDTPLHDPDPLKDSAAHADFPPRSITGDADGNIPDPPLCLHFDDEEEVWDKDKTFRVALHEIGHTLGLDHYTPPAPTDGSPPKRAVMEPVLWSFSDLQDDDRAGIRSLYTVPGPQRFNFIWMAGTLERRAEWGVTPDDIETVVKQHQDDGFQPTRLNAYVLPDGGLRYNVVLEKIDQRRHWLGAHDREDFEQKRKEYEGQGYRLIDVNNVVDAAGEARYNAVWARNGVDMLAFVGLGLVDLEKTINTYKDKRYRPITVNGYQTPGGESGYNLIVVKQGQLGDGRFWRATWNAQRDELLAVAEQNEADGYTPTDYNALVLPISGGERWNGIWEKLDPEPEWQRRAGWVEIDARRRTGLLEQEGLAPWVLNAYVRPTAPATTTAQPATLDQAPAGQHAMVLGLAVDERRVYATRSYQLLAPPETVTQPGLLVVLDRQTLQPVPELPQLPGHRRGVAVGHDPRAVAVNPATGKIYVANRGKDSYSLSVIDGASLAVRKTIALGQGPVDVAINSRTNRVYVGNVFQRLIHVIDGATDEPLAPIPIGPGPLGMAVDETTNTLYVALCNRSFPPFVNGLGAVIDDGAHREILPVVPIDPLGIDSQDVAVDPEGDRIYVANQGNVGAGPASVSVFHRPSRTLLATVPLTSAARNLALNADAGEVYVTCDAGVVHVVDTVSLTRSRSIPVGPLPWAVAAAPGTARQVFVGDRLDGSVVRLS